MIELLGIFLLAGTVTSVVVINAVHRPYETRSDNPHDFDITAVEAYNRILAALSTEKIGTHDLKLKETIDPLYVIADLSYQDDIGNKCDAQVTFDVVEGYKNTTTIRWSCKFLRWCERSTAQAVEQLLDEWIETCLGPESALQANAISQQLPTAPPENIVNDSVQPADIKRLQSKQEISPIQQSAHAERIEQTAPVTSPVVKKLRSNYPREFAYLKVMQRISSAPEKNTKWKLIECNPGNSITARATYTPSQNSNTACNVELTILFEEDARAEEFKCVYLFSPDCDINTAQSFLEATQEWMEIILR